MDAHTSTGVKPMRWAISKGILVRLVATFLFLSLLPTNHAEVATAATQSSSPFSSDYNPWTSSIQSVVVNGRAVAVNTPYTPRAEWVQPSGKLSAILATVNPSRDLSLEAVPYGTSATGEAVSIAAAAKQANWLNSITEFHRSQPGFVATQTTQPITILGTSAPGIVSELMNLPNNIGYTTLVAEWVGDDGANLWIVRAEYSFATADTASMSLTAFASNFRTLTVVPGNISSTSPTTADMKLTAARVSGNVVPQPPMRLVSANTVSAPSWWNGYTCDASHNSQHTSLATWRGLAACGSNDDVQETFPGASLNELEWECVELSMRWLYLEYGQEPYSAYGYAVVSNYASHYSGPLVAVSNNGSQLPAPGDILSYGTSSPGHTSVVTGVTATQISVIQQNDTNGATENLSISNGVIQYNPMPSGWLHADYVAGADSGNNIKAFSYTGGSQVSISNPTTSVTVVAVSGPWIGYVSGGNFYIYDESTDTSYHEFDGILAGTRRAIGIGYGLPNNFIGVIDTSNNFWVKSGLTGAWNEESGTVAAIGVSPTQFVMLYTGDNNVYGKPAIGGGWTQLSSGGGVTDVTASSDWTGYIQSGYGYARSGLSGTNNTECGSSATSMDLSANYIICVDGSGLRAKAGLGGGWNSESLGGSGSAAQVSAGDSGIAYRDSNGFGWAMVGISGSWTQEIGSGGVAMAIGKG